MQKPYACQIKNCNKKYTDPSSLRKHVKNHTPEEQMQLKTKNASQLEEFSMLSARLASRLSSNATNTTNSITSITTTSVMIKQEIKVEETKHNSSQTTSLSKCNTGNSFYANYEHDYTVTRLRSSFDVKQDLKNKLSEKLHRNINYK